MEKDNYYRYIFIVKGLPNFPTHELVTLKNTLSISHSSRPLSAGPIQNAENMESLLLMVHFGTPLYNKRDFV